MFKELDKRSVNEVEKAILENWKEKEEYINKQNNTNR